MSLANTTASAAIAESDKQIIVAAATGFAIGNIIRVGDENMRVTKGYVASSTTVPVFRGQDGTVAKAWATGVQVTTGAASDFVQQTVAQNNSAFPISGRGRVITSIAADGAIALPPAGNDALCVITGTAHTGLTLAVPTKDLNGCKLAILDLTGAAHVITIAGGIGGGALVTATFDATGRCYIEFMAYNEIWYLGPNLSGTLTSFDVALT